MMLRFCLFAILFATTSLFSSSVVLFNDSPFVLHATVLSADGETLGSFTVFPQKQTVWQDSYLGASQFSKTPYTVIWTCKNGDEFGSNYQVASGATVTPQGSMGRRYCKPEKEKQPQGVEGQSPGY